MHNIIQISCLGRYGRFGNQLFQYAFARAYAEKYNCVLETPPWVGEFIFGVHHNRPSRKLPAFSANAGVPTGEVNIDLVGYFVNDAALNLMTRQWLRRIYTIKPGLLHCVPKESDYYIAAHLRRGDYAALSWPMVTEQSYLTACDKHGLDRNKIVWISEDKARKVQDFENNGVGFLADFIRLINADVILRANSTFSWWASTLSNAHIYSPLIGDMVGPVTVEFVDGNWPKFVKLSGGEQHTDLHLT